MQKMGDIQPADFKESAFAVAKKLMELYWSPLYKYLKQNEDLIKTVTGLLLNHEKVVFYFGKTHLAVEYFGSERLEALVAESTVRLIYHDLTLSNENFIEQIVGFKFDSSAGIAFPLPFFAEDLVLPTNSGADKLIELK